MKLILHRSFYLVLLTALALVAKADDVGFYATVNKNVVTVNETFQVTFTIENGDARGFKAPSFDEFNVRGGPNQSTSMQIVNGNVTRSVSFSYYLQPKKEGKFTIGSATLEDGNKKLSTQTVTIEVTKVGGSSSGPPSSGGSQQRNSGSQIGEHVFLRLLVDKKEVYQGEQVTVTYKLYTDLNISNLSLIKDPNFNGFWSQEIESPSTMQYQTEVYNGVRYNAAVIKKVALFAQRSGELEIDPMELSSVVRVPVRRGGGGIFDFFGSYQEVPFDFSSRGATITVKPLPPGKPRDFSGIVGSMSLDASINKTETQTDDPVTLKLSFSGNGNMRMLEVPRIDLPKDFEVFDPKVSERMSDRATTVSGSKSIEYLIIPRRPGEFKINSVSLSYFDLEKEKYVTLSSPDYTITVTGEASTVSSGGQISGISKEDVELLGEDIRHIKTGDAELKESDYYFVSSLAFGGLYAAPFLLFALLFAVRRSQERVASDKVLLRRRKASKVAAQRLSKAKTYLKEAKRKEFYDELGRGMWGYLGDKLAIQTAALSREVVKEKLVQRNVREDTMNAAFKLIDNCEMALFTPDAGTSAMEHDFKEASGIIDKLEGELK